MVDETRNEQESEKTGQENVVPAETGKEETVAPKTVTIADGQVIPLDPNHMAVLVIMDPAVGSPMIFNVQNCPLRAYSRMLLTEALNLYSLTSQANLTAGKLFEVLTAAAKADKKKGLFNPLAGK